MSEMHTATLLVSSARIVLNNPSVVHDLLCDHLAEHIQVKRHEDGALFVTDFGTARTEISGDTVLVALESADETGLSFLKHMVAEHLLEFAGEHQPVIRWSGDGKIGQLLPYFREMRVVSVGNVTPLMRRIVLSGYELTRFATGGLHVRLLFPPAGIAPPQWPVNGEDGRPRWPQGAAKPEARVYTIRFIDIDKGEVTIDMLLHGDTEDHPAPGAGFARHAQPGDIIGMTGPFGGTLAETSRYILLGDETALPAIGRMLETMPAAAQASIFVEVSSPEEEQELLSAANIDPHWLHRNSMDPAAGSLAKIIRAHPWLSDGGPLPFIWAGCEHAQAREIRQFALKEARLARDTCSITAYWRQGGIEDEAGTD